MGEMLPDKELTSLNYFIDELCFAKKSALLLLVLITL